MCLCVSGGYLSLLGLAQWGDVFKVKSLAIHMFRLKQNFSLKFPQG